MAQEADAVIDFSGSEDVWGIGTTKLIDAQSFTYGGYTIVLTGTTGGGYRWYDSGNIILGKKDATLQLPAFDFDVQRIDIVGTSGASAAVVQNIFVSDEAVSTETTGAKDVTNSYVIAEGKQAAGTIYTLKVISNHNTQITKILIYKKGTNVKEQAGLSWGKASVTATIGGENEFPTLSNPHSLPVTYSTSDASIATISQSGDVTLVAAGKCDVIAEFAGNDQYEAQTVKYILTVKAAEQPAQEITVARALEIIGDLEDGATTTEKYKVKGFIVGTPDFQRKTDNTLYGNCNFEIADAKGGSPTLTVFRAKSFENKNFTEEEVAANILKEGDEVVLEGQLQKFKSGDNITPEIKNCYLISVNGQTSHVAILKADILNAPAYNVGGQRVNEGYKGLVIKGGKKLIQK